MTTSAKPSVTTTVTTTWTTVITSIARTIVTITQHPLMTTTSSTRTTAAATTATRNKKMDILWSKLEFAGSVKNIQEFLGKVGKIIRRRQIHLNRSFLGQNLLVRH